MGIFRLLTKSVPLTESETASLRHSTRSVRLIVSGTDISPHSTRSVRLIALVTVNSPLSVREALIGSEMANSPAFNKRSFDSIGTRRPEFIQQKKLRQNRCPGKLSALQQEEEEFRPDWRRRFGKVRQKAQLRFDRSR